LRAAGRRETVTRKLLIILIAGLVLALSAAAIAQDAAPMDADAAMADAVAADADAAESRDKFRQLDQDVQTLKKEVLDLNRDLFLLEEELLFPANSQVAFFISMDVGEYFELDSISLKIDGKEVANYLYTEREVGALLRGGVHRVHMANLKTGDHELVAIFTGAGPHTRDYRRGATMNFNKGTGAKYLELEITDRVQKQQPEFVIKEWE
jgi:hypothetical protein